MERDDPSEARETTEPPTVTYRVTLDDAVEFSAYHRAHSPTLRRLGWWNHKGTALLYLAVGLILYALHPSPAALVYFGLLAALWLVCYPAYAKWSIGRRIRRTLSEGQKRGQFGATSLTLLPEGILAVGEDGESKIKWRGVEKIVTTHNKVYIYIGATSALTVPRSAFTTEEALHRFIDTAMRYREIAVEALPTISA